MGIELQLAASVFTHWAILLAQENEILYIIFLT